MKTIVYVVVMYNIYLNIVNTYIFQEVFWYGDTHLLSTIFKTVFQLLCERREKDVYLTLILFI